MPADGLSRAQIVAASIEILDTDGVDGLSMRKLGARLGSGATSVYWHVGNRTNLVRLAVDAAFGELELPDPDDVGWRAAMRTAARGLRDLALRHRWLAPALGSLSNANGPHVARYQNHSVLTCESAGFRGEDVDWAGSTLFAFVIGSVWGEATPGPDDRQAGADAARAAATGFPRLLDRIEALSAAAPERVREDSFEFGLRAIVDGLAARLADP